MDLDPDIPNRRLLQQVANKKTTKSIKQTINAAILLRAAHTRSCSAKPRKVIHWLVDCSLGLTGLIVGQHEESLLTLIHHIPL